MDGVQVSISPQDFYTRLGTAAAPILVDIRPPPAFAQAQTLITSALACPPEEVERWRSELPRDRPAVVYCGHEASQNAAAALRAASFDARHLDDGIEAWEAAKLPTRRKIGATRGKWVTRERPKIDRIACPWLIKRFFDPDAEFIYVLAREVLAVANATGAAPYDIDGVAFTHEDERCSFDTILRIYDIHDPALDRLATIVRGADTSRHDLAPQCAGLFAISLGLSANFPNDHAMLTHGITIYAALYTWSRSLQAETHNWPAKTAA